MTIDYDVNKAWTFQHVRQTAKHEAECFAQRNCDVIQNGAETVNHGTKKHGSAFMGRQMYFYYLEWLFVYNQNNVGYLQITTLQFYYF